MENTNKKLDKKNIENILALSPMQEGILFYYLLNKESDYYLEQLQIKVSGKIDIVLFEKAWNIVAKTNEMLRTVFRWETLKNPIQVVLKSYDVKIILQDMSEHVDVEGTINAIVQKDKEDAFDLTEVPFRVALCKLYDNSYMLLISNHHILYDGWSNGIILKEFFEIYNALVNQETVAPDRKAKYEDYIKWLGNSDKGAQTKYWDGYLRDYEPKAILQHNLLKDNNVKEKITSYALSLPTELVNKVSGFTKSNEVTLAALMYSAWGILLFQYCNEHDVAFGTTVSVRPVDISGISNVVGLCINTVPLRVMADENENVLDFIKKINGSLTERKEYEATPLTDIMAYNGISRDEGLFQSIFVIENYPLSAKLFNRDNVLNVESYAHFGRSNYDITVMAKTFDSNICLEFQYNSCLFDESAIERLANRYGIIIEELIAKSGVTLNALNILSQQERDEILLGYNHNTTSFEGTVCVHEYFEKQTDENPDKIAIVQGSMVITYKELNEQSNKLARLILRKQRITPDTAIGIMAYPSIEMIIGLMAILKSGGAYVPLDPDSPSDRNSYILQDSNAAMLLTSSDITQIDFWDGDTLLIDGELTGESEQNLRKTAAADNLAYIIYTSGSTGHPKGVMIEHRSLVNKLLDLETRYPMLENDTFLLKTTYTFDVSVTEIMGWFMGRGRLAVLEKGHEKDPSKIIDAIETYDVTHINIVPSMFRYLLEYMYQKRDSVKRLSGLKFIFSAGEALKADLVEKFNVLNTNALLENLYGPTESTIYSTGYSLNEFEGGTNVPIGKPLSNLHAYIVDKHNRLQPVGVPGELCLSGVGISRGYVNREQLTGEKIVFNPFVQEIEDKSELNYRSYYDRMYKTGDLARWMPDGNIEYLGRNDFQIKIRGFRIELEEIENMLLTFGEIGEAVVVPKTDTDGSLYLCAYYTSSNVIANEEIINYLSSALPAYMVPSIFMKIDKMPLTTSGKIDRKYLPEPDHFRPELQVAYTAPQTNVQSEIMDVWKQVLNVDKIGILDNFFDIGGNSLKLIRVSSRLSEIFKMEVSITNLFQYPTIQSLANFLREDNNRPTQLPDETATSNNQEAIPNLDNNSDIAIIGMACRFPGADNTSEFWDKLRDGVECISFFEDEDLINAGVSQELVADPNYVKAQGAMNNPEYFDSEFFKYSPREAEIMDPQMRVFHEVVWEALEDSGYSSSAYREPIGLYSSASPNLFWESLVALSGKAKILGEFASEQLFNKDYMSTRVSYKLNLTGPSVSLYTACSSSLVSVHVACESLINNECSIAIAGSSTISPLPDKTGYLYQDGMVKSPDGHLRAFDINAAGFVGGTGAGAVVLKRLSDAIADSDNILAVIKGTAINNDGSNKIGYTAPSIDGLKRVMQEALRKARVAPESIGYIETHGTATPLGDTVEVEAMKPVFHTGKRNYCGIGSVKTNIGHLDCTSGVAGLIKTVLALKHKMIPPTLNVTVANPKLNLIDSPFYLATELTEWNNDEMPLRAGVNSLGLGGTNAHVIVEEAPVLDDEVSSRPHQLIMLSARTESALFNQIKQLATHLQEHPEVNMADLSYTLQIGRTHFAYRTTFTVEDRSKAIEQLNAGVTSSYCTENTDTHIVFNFVSSGIQNMVKWIELYKTEAVFKKYMDECLAVLSPYIAHWFIHVIDNQMTLDEAYISSIQENSFIIFSLQYALAKTLVSWGIRPDSIKGDGMEEAVIIALSNKARLEDIAYSIISKLEHIKQNTGSVIRGNDAEEPSETKVYINVDFGIIGVHGTATTDRINTIKFVINPNEGLGASGQLLEKLGQLWKFGVTIDWGKLHSEEKRRRISLPTYPFERQRYWIDGNPFTTMPLKKSEGIAKKQNMSEWFYAPLWEQSLMNVATDPIDSHEHSGWMVLMDDTHFHTRLVDELETRVGTVIRIRKGIVFGNSGENDYHIDPKQENDYKVLLNQLAANGKLPSNIVSLWGVSENNRYEELTEENVYKELNSGFFSITYLAKALASQSSASETRITVVTSSAHNVDGSGRSNPAKAAVLGPCKVIPQELTFVSCRNIDISIPEALSQQHKLVQKLVNEMTGTEDTVVAYRNNIRYTQRYAPVELPESSSNKFKKHGVYLITGGMGSIGFSIAEDLASNYQAKLILLGRSPFPKRGEREQWLADKGDHDPLASKVKRVIELEQQGAEVYTYSGDISNYVEIRSIVEDAERRTGEINGIIHAAGAMRESLFKTLDEINREDCEKQFAPKIFGTMVLHRLFGEKELDFFTVTSSTSSVLGGLGFTAYSAANIFMDSFISEFNRASGKDWISVNWEGWKFGNEGIDLNFNFSLSELFMEPEEGVEAFNRITNSHGLGRVIVSSGSLDDRLNSWIKLDTLSKDVEAEKKNQVKIDRNVLKTSYVSPDNKMEQTIAEVFQDFFGYKEIGTDDNFFDLGATSLDMIQITGNLRNALHMNIPILKLFMFPTIHSLAQNLTASGEEAVASENVVDRSDEIKKGRSSILLRQSLRKK